MNFLKRRDIILKPRSLITVSFFLFLCKQAQNRKWQLCLGLIGDTKNLEIAKHELWSKNTVLVKFSRLFSKITHHIGIIIFWHYLSTMKKKNTKPEYYVLARIARGLQK